MIHTQTFDSRILSSLCCDFNNNQKKKNIYIKGKREKNQKTKEPKPLQKYLDGWKIQLEQWYNTKHSLPNA